MEENNKINMISSDIDGYGQDGWKNHNRYNTELLKILAKDYKVRLDDPQGCEKHYDFENVNKNVDIVQLDRSISKTQALIMYIKRKQHLNNLLKERGINYFDKLWKENLSDKGYKFCKNMYEKYNILPIADKEILDYFSRVMGTIYNGNSLGNFSIIRSRSSIENWSGRVKHEGIHARQGGFKKRISSFFSLIKKRSELNGLVPWAMDYATDNQISDRETYINQYKDDPIKDIKPYEFMKYNEKKNRFDAIKNHMQTDIDETKKYIDEIKTKMRNIKSGKINLDTNKEASFTKEERLQNLEYILKTKEHDLNTMEKLQSQHDNAQDWHQLITFGEQDGYIYGETPEKRQTNFQSDEALRKQVVLDMFITHYGDKKDNYKGACTQ